MSQSIKDRRQFLARGTAFLTAFFMGSAKLSAKETDNGYKAIIDRLTGGKAVEGPLNVQLPEIAENGNTVPLSVSVENPMTADNYVKEIHVVCDGNPRPEVASFYFTPVSGKAAISTRMRLLKSQNVYAVAVLSNGSILQAKRPVKVTIGGCGG